MQPINYGAMLDPNIGLGALQQGFGAVQQIKDLRAAEQAKQAAMQKEQQYRADLEAAMNDGGPRAMAGLIAKYPEQREALKASWDIQEKDAREAQWLTTAQMYNALQQNDTETAIKLANVQREAARNSRQPTDGIDAIIESIKTDPNAAKASIGLFMSILEPEKFGKAYETQIKMEDRPAAKAKAALDVMKAEQDIVRSEVEQRNLASQIAERSSRLGLDERKFAQEVLDKDRDYRLKIEAAGKQPESVSKVINEAAVASTAAMAQADEAEALTKQLAELDVVGGTAATVSEALARTFASQDELSRFRQRVDALTSKQILANLPPGVATDRDIEFASRGFPSSNAPKKTLDQYLRGINKIAKYNAAAEEAKVDWVSNFGNLGRAKRAVEVDGIQIKPGMTYADYAKKYAEARYGVANKVEDIQSTTPAQAPGDRLAAQRGQLVNRATQQQPKPIVVDF